MASRQTRERRRDRPLGLAASLMLFLAMSGVIAVSGVMLFILFDPRTQEWLGIQLATVWAAVVGVAAAVAGFFAPLFRR